MDPLIKTATVTMSDSPNREASNYSADDVNLSYCWRLPPPYPLYQLAPLTCLEPVHSFSQRSPGNYALTYNVGLLLNGIAMWSLKRGPSWEFSNTSKDNTSCSVSRHLRPYRISCPPKPLQNRVV